MWFVSFYRFSLGDCTKNGVSARYNSAYVITPEEIGDREWEENTLVWVKRELWGKCCDYLVPINLYDADKTNHLPVMMGGNYAFGDSRFSDEVSRFPLPVHDRVESWEEYEALSH